MNKYNRLLSKIADEYGLKKGRLETEECYKSRIVYSLLGRMALAALNDENEEDSSINAMKKRIIKVASAYIEMYPEIKKLFPIQLPDMADEIFDIFLRAGVIYHKPNRIVAAAETKAATGGVTFTRGCAIDEKQSLSGLGTYRLKEEKTSITSEEMFCLNETTLSERWKRVIEKAIWTEFHDSMLVEYLRLEQPFSNGYWCNNQNNDGRISIMRSGIHDPKLYYLYKMENGKLLISQLPQWLTEQQNYRTLACACLNEMGTFPRIKYKKDGDIVSLHFGFLPPPAELYLWKLYSWPMSMIALPCDFRRICAEKVFTALRNIMEKQGYCFIEE